MIRFFADRGTEEAGRHGIRVNEQYRITFRFAADGPWEVRCEDYH